MTLAVTLVTVPLVALYFNQVAWLGLLANVIVVPYAGFVIVPLGLVSAVGVLVFDSAQLPMGALNQAVFDFLATSVSLMATVPSAEWQVASPSLIMIFLYFVLLWVVWRGDFPRFVHWTSVLGLALLLLWWMASPRWIAHPDNLRVTFLDVGQGDATVVELPDGRTLLIDGGVAYGGWDAGRGIVAPFLWDRGITSLDHVIATHPQRDHVGGLEWITKNFDVRRFWHNGIIRDEQFFQRLKKTIRDREIVEDTAVRGEDIVDSGPCRLGILNPPPSHEGTSHQDSGPNRGTLLNNLSIITRLDCGPHSFLFTADAEIEALGRLVKNAQRKTVTVVKIPHHGAKSSLHEEWIRRLDSDIAVVSVGRRNRYGHPSPKVLEAYTQAGMRVYRTDQDGAVWIEAKLDSPELSISTAKNQLPIPVRLDAHMWEKEVENLKRLWHLWIGLR